MHTLEVARSQPAAMSSGTGAHLIGLHLTVVLAGNIATLPLLKIGGVVGLVQVQPTLQPPDRLRGKMPLNGRSVPVLDLRVLFGLRPDFTEHTRLVVVWLGLPAARRDPLALVVDRVEDVVALNEELIGPPPMAGLELDRTYLRGVTREAGPLHQVLDLDRLATKRI
ncbi:MAG: chemotaxis protein CheW [Verrucomicrobia bacterium]|nr:chemotaxis protein CheW [Verrucomicrobiota bacterium]